MKEKKMTRKQIVTMVIALAIPLLTGGFSAFLTARDMDVYETLTRPFLAPPGWLFPIVWTLLYIVMGLASYFIMVSDAEPKEKQKALRVYMAQLIMNFFWSTLFFTYREFLISFLWLLAMWVLVLICAIRFYRIRRAAGWMMGALFLWTTFASYLNLSYYVMSMTPMV